MIKKTLLSFMLLLGFAVAGFAQTKLMGKVTDENNEPVPFAVLKLFRQGVYKTGTEADLDGNYLFNNVDPGEYEVEASYVGFTPIKMPVTVKEGRFNEQNFQLGKGVVMTTVEISAKKPLVEVDNVRQGGTLTAKQLEKLPTRDINAIATTVSGTTQSLRGGDVNVKGGRGDQTAYIVDGVRVRGSSTVPVSAVEQIEVITGGLDAKYGDFTGGGIVITTKGAPEKFTGYFEGETSNGLDPYKTSFLEGSISGPIWRKTRTDKFATYKESVLGFRVSGTYRTAKDNSPSAVGVYQINNDALARLQENPVAYIGTGTPIAAAELLTAKDFNLVKANPYNRFSQLDLTTKLDAKLAKNMKLSTWANLYRIEDQFTPDGWDVYNNAYNPVNLTNRWRANVRLTQRFSTPAVDSSRKNKFRIENASYELIFGYEQGTGRTWDDRFQDRYFEYGHVGNVNYRYVPAFQIDTSNTFQHVGYTQTFAGYTPGTANPVLTRYNTGADVANGNLNIRNSFIPDQLQSIWSIFTNVGRPYNSVVKSDNRQVTGAANFTLDILPNGKRDQLHSVQFGFYYEQQINRRYSVAPFALWQLAENQQNAHINGIDPTRKLRDTVLTLPNGALDTVAVYDLLLVDDIAALADVKFYKSLRDKFYGGNLRTYGNVNRFNPSDLTLDMFSAQELNDQAILSYRGYDYLGNLVGTNVTFDEFFTARDANGVRTFPVAPLQPIYFAGYVQDKFRYKDIIFNFGLRVDRYDANTKVMKDPYSLYDIISAKDYYQKVGQPQPNNIGDDFKVYTNRDRSGVTAYRRGDQWYDAKGNQTDPLLIFGDGGKPIPFYARDSFADIKSRGFDPSNSFTDYIPQVNWMPRLSFSFPISKEANFFAHYDVLVSRPSSGTEVTALNYYYFDDAGRTPSNNANLRPERTVDYQVGFQQLLTKNSAITLSAYYREMRDMIQSRYYRFLPGQVNEYTSLGNLDFGTVKGFTAKYELRNVGNFSGTFNYTLQFADGTGSDPASQQGLNRRGNIRSLSPLNYDERHRLAWILDYRYGSGSEYDGPKLFGKNIFEATGLNIQLISVSGRPYTARQRPARFGGEGIAGLINGSRLPWSFNVDIRLDKTFRIVKATETKKPLDLNVYFRIQNLFDTQNILGVYSASGSASDDGYLATPLGQAEVLNVRLSRPTDVLAFLNSYQMNMLNGGFYSFPRRIFIGANFGF